MALVPVFHITVFVPPSRAQTIVDGVLAIDSLAYGDYDSVVWVSSAGAERFRPLPGSNATEGDINRLEVGDSVQVVFSIPRDDDLLERVLDQGIRPSHPWEEPVIYVTEARAGRKPARASHTDAE